MSEEYFKKLTEKEDKIEKLYIDGKLDKVEYEMEMDNVRLARQFEQRELLK